MRTGRLIVLEGSEGAGKTTQLKLLADALRASGNDVLTLREPSDRSAGLPWAWAASAEAGARAVQVRYLCLPLHSRPTATTVS